VNFIIKHDKKEHFLFASLQSDAAKEILLQFPSKKIDFSSIIFIKNEISYNKSTAALLISKQLNGGYKLIYFLIVIPKFIRDFVYDYIAKNRYQWFGKRDSCNPHNKTLKKRFI
jgi:predicted DCC family thiol-disulfide oxidoreductase YuxK